MDFVKCIVEYGNLGDYLAFSLRGCYLILSLLVLGFSFCGFVGFLPFFIFSI